MSKRRARRLSIGRVSWPRTGQAALAGALFGAGDRGARRLAVAAGAALLIYGVVGGLALRASFGHQNQPPPRPLEEMTVELLAPPPPPPPEPPPPTPPPAVRPRTPSVPSDAPPPTPAAAAPVIAHEPSEAPVDLGSFTITAGTSAAFAGGATAARGTSTGAVTGTPSFGGVADGTGSANLSSPVALLDDEWSCPWPRQAESLGIDEEDGVVIRVTVLPDGNAEAVELVRDPGHGFGAAALGCARTSKFSPARDAGGTAIRARSGPIQVKFTR